MRVLFLAVGGGTFAVSYGVPLAVAAGHNFRDQGGWFFAPVIGPVTFLATRRGCSDTTGATGALCGFGDTMLTIGVVTDALMQAGGAALLVAGLLLPSAKPPVARPHVTPVSGGAVVGLTLAM